MADNDAIEQAKKELEVLRSMPETLHPLMEGAFRSLQAIIDGQKPKVLDWGRVMDLMIIHKPRTVTVGMVTDTAVCRTIYQDGEYQPPVVASSSWDEPFISLDYGPPMPCWVEVESLDSPRYCQTWPLIIVSKLKAAGITMIKSK
ncbi:hypothetical protein Q6670_004095 [Salmonella enterica]|nr:hypothetical protein [Salmonella enterica]